ncbi:DNA phosphorothioation system sulfurtransferase DndC [Tumebacillus sp. DT12]|uniref:DNA phosphorothioation system sulfurtransferase DndC n=1 Tax=Tumebacillus lacus TaxID=2995335 RepID=A0ABT3WWY9_9BACL|nr:DNA phosphorothioation system sulfurtransferase DndC [Tumebacillus lacus]MCX7569192.1 DNA phosphorothioation system sulfurtransferase DndC [Tumebacillus lacus]
MMLDLLDRKKIADRIKQIQDMYLEDSRPWVVGYSGGKDSTVIVQLVFHALSELPKEKLTKKVYVISSDTLVETPLIISSISLTLKRIQEKALELGMPFETHKVRPDAEKTFWASLIGKGYPSPRQKFRWCTDRMKIDPANKFILDRVSEYGEVIMVLGVRDDESATRAQVMSSHTVEGKTLMRHSTLNNAYVYAPIRDFTLDDVWSYLLNEPSPWGNDNHELMALYQNSQSGECPLIVDKEIKESAGSCGNSRFGCWVCTVVVQDKALIGFIENGEEWLIPLLEFRNWLSDIRDVREYRQKHRIDGTIYFVGQDEDRKLGLGPFTLEARKMILRRLLEVQKEVQNPYDPNYTLILEEELRVIRKIWSDNGDWEDSVPQIYREVMGEDLDWEYDDRSLFEDDQMTDLETLCKEFDVDIQLIKRLINIEKKYSGYKVRRGLFQEFERILNQDWLHYGKVEGYKE